MYEYKSIQKNDLIKFIEDTFRTNNLNSKPSNLKIDNPDLFLASYLADEFTKIDPELSGLVQTLFRNVGRKVLMLDKPGIPRYVSRITFENRLRLPHNDILEIMKATTGEIKEPSHDNIRNICFKPLTDAYQRSPFVIHDQCISDGTTTLNLFDILKSFNIRFIGTDIAMYYYCLTRDLKTEDVNIKTTNNGNPYTINSSKADQIRNINNNIEGAIFDHEGQIKQVKYNGNLILYHPISRKARTLKIIVSNLINKIQHTALKRRYKELFKKMRDLLRDGSEVVKQQGYMLCRKKFLNPQYHYYPQVVFKDHDITKSFNERSSIMLVFNSLKLGYFEKRQIDAAIPAICNSLKEGGLLFIGEGEFENIAYSVFQKKGNLLKFAYKVGQGASIESMILSRSWGNGVMEGKYNNPL